MTTRDFQTFWFLWVAALLVVEGWALFRKARGDTLSEYTWMKVRGWPLRATLGATLVWLLWHWLFAPSGAPGLIDLGFAMAGAGLGYWSYLRRAR